MLYSKEEKKLSNSFSEMEILLEMLMDGRTTDEKFKQTHKAFLPKFINYKFSSRSLYLIKLYICESILIIDWPFLQRLMWVVYLGKSPEKYDPCHENS